MSGFNIATGALTTNLAALQVIGQNIANVNTPGYSRQTPQQQQIPGQLIGSGYYGKGVEIAAVERNYNAFLTREANLSASLAASDGIRFRRLEQLEQLFPMGEAGLGSQLNTFLNSWADVVASPLNQTARGVVLSTAEQIAARLRQSANQLDELQVTTRTQIEAGIDTVNRLAKDIAGLNQRIIEAYGVGRPPNDLLDQRDRVVAELNKYVQTKTLEADDRSLTVFIAGSYPLVLGSTANALVNPPVLDPAGDLVLALGNKNATMNTELLGGGELQGLLRFYNHDVGDVRNQLGRLAMSMMELTNRQHQSGLDLNGQDGKAFFGPVSFATAVVKISEGSAAELSLSVDPGNADAPTQFKASDYSVRYTAANTVEIRRVSDGLYLGPNGATSATPLTFTFPPPVAPETSSHIAFDGLRLTQSASGAAGDQILLSPFANVAEQVRVALTSPSQLAVASPVLVQAGANNGDTLQVASLSRPYNTGPAPAWTNTVVTFQADGRYTLTTDGGTPTGPFDFVSGQPIVVQGAGGFRLFELTLRGAPKSGDNFTVRPPNQGESMAQNTGNGQALLALRDANALDGYSLSDGYIPVFSSVASSIQSAKSAATFSSQVAQAAEAARANQAGVNLDEEAARLLQYQQAYQAAAKYLQSIQSSFDTLLQAFGR